MNEFSRFSSPSEYSQALAASILEDQEFVNSFLAKSQKRLLQNRLLAECLLDRTGIEYYDKGCVSDRPFPSLLMGKPEMLAFFCG